MEKTGSKPIDELVRRAIIGDGTAFAALWDRHIDQLRSYLRSSMKTLDDFYIEDVCSRSFEKAFRQIGSYDPSKSQFVTWLKTIAHNTALDVIEGEKRRTGNTVPLDSGTQVPDQLDSPLESIIHYEDERTTQECIEGLPELYREVARKRLVDGLKYQEIAEETGLELNTVRTRIRRAKEIMEKMQDEKDSV